MRHLIACCLAAAAVMGAAHAEPRALSGFTKVSASAGTNVQVTVGPAFSVDVSGRDADRIATRVSSGVLIVEPVPNWTWRGRRDALVRVIMPAIEGLEASSGARLSANGVAGGAIALEASSGANIDVAGVCSSFTAEASSGANLNASSLRCEDGAVGVSSGARAHVYATGQLDVDASSGGDVIASGNPGIGDVDLSSGGSLRRAT